MGFFQSVNYYALLKDIPGINPFFLNGKDSSGGEGLSLAGALLHSKGKLKKRITTRVLILEEPQNSVNDCGILNRIDWRFRHATGQTPIYTELRLLEPPRNPDSLAALPFSEKHSYLNILVDTTLPEEYLYSCLSGSKKRQVQSSLAAGAVVRPAHSEKEVHDFYAILSDLYRNKIRKPLMPEEVFLRIFRNKNSGVVLIASHDGCITGGMLCPFSSDGVMYEWYIAGQDRKKKSSKIYPSVLLTWEAIRYAAVNGFRQFNFMGAGESGKPYGTRDFKLQFGGKLVEAPRYLFIHKPFLYRLGKMALQLGLGS